MYLIKAYQTEVYDSNGFTKEMSGYSELFVKIIHKISKAKILS